MVVKTKRPRIEGIEPRRKEVRALGGSKEKYKTLVAASQDAMVDVDEKGRIILWNKGAERIFGYSAKEILDQPVTKLMAEEYRERHRKGFESFLNGNRRVRRFVEGEGLRKDGSRFPIEWSLSSWPENGKTIVTAVGKDVSARKKAEESAREAEERYNAIFNNQLQMVYIHDGQGRFLDANDAALRQLGYVREEIGRLSFPDIAYSEDLPKAFQAVEEVMTKGYMERPIEIRVITKSGEMIWIETVAIPLELGDGHYKAMGIAHDITERKEAESKRKQAEELYTTFANSSQIGVYIVQDGRFQFVNPQFQSHTGFSQDELLGIDPLTIVHPEDREMVRENAVKMLKRERSSPYEFRAVTKGGETRWVMETVISIQYQGKRATLGNYMDVTERKRAEEALRASEGKWRSLAKNAPNIIMVVNRDGKIEFINRAVPAVNVVEMIGKSIYDYAQPEYQNLVKEIIEHVFQTGGTDGYEAKWVGPDGGISWYETQVGPIEHDGRVVAVTLITSDITERKNAEKRLKSSFINLAETVSRAVESRDPYTAGHQRGVAELAQLVGEMMGLDEDRLQGLYIGGLLHDIGKVSIPASILTKLGDLTEEEWALICTHPKQGYNILKDTKLPWPVADMALHHHEQLDGSGYPHGISGDALSLEVRILAVCDVVEAMGSHRPYRPAKTKKEVLREIKSGRGTKYDASIVDVVLQILENGEFNFAWNGRNSKSTATKVLVR